MYVLNNVQVKFKEDKAEINKQPPQVKPFFFLKCTVTVCLLVYIFSCPNDCVSMYIHVSLSFYVYLSL